MNHPQRTPTAADQHPSEPRYLEVTHEVTNQPRPLENYNLYQQDTALQEGVLREGAGHAHDQLTDYGAWAGLARSIELGHQANAQKP
ncbi:MAG TPA: DNA alkylation response protein, partial [Marinobacter sp.]|nr:DNA alkylation response protein [Marinobacter sp.]